MQLCRETIKEETPCRPNLCTNKSAYIQSLGPYPDEIILTLIDRVWYLISSTGIIDKLFPSWSKDDTLESVPDAASCQNMRCPRGHITSHNMSRIVSESQCYDTNSKMISIAEKCNCDKCGKSFTHSRTFVKKSASKASTSKAATEKRDSPEIKVCPPKTSQEQPRPILKSAKIFLPIRKSFSLCSLACRRLKQRLTFELPPKPTSEMSWCWSRMRCTPDGTKILEVFNYTSADPHMGPMDIKETTYPQMIFIILKNGVTVPFETLSSH